MLNQLKVEKFKACRFWLMYIAVAVLAVAGFLFGFIKFPEEAMTDGIFSDVVCDTSFIFIITLVSAWFVRRYLQIIRRLKTKVLHRFLNRQMMTFRYMQTENFW